MWLQNFGFLGVAMFSTIILTRPNVSAWLLLSFLLVGVVLSALYKDRVFCRYVCPVGGFIGLYSLLSPLELRVADPDVCADHKTKDCITGNENGYGCPWMVFPGSLTRNVYCGMCFECLKTCPKNNIVLNLRPFGSDLMVAKERRLDEAYKAFIMLGCALLYSAVLLGPWGWLKNWANMDTLPHWALYAPGFVTFNLVLLPGLFGLIVWLIRRFTPPAAPPAPDVCRLRLHADPVGTGRVDRVQLRLCAGQRQLRAGGAVRSVWLGLEPVRHGRHALDAARRDPDPVSASRRADRRAAVCAEHGL